MQHSRSALTAPGPRPGATRPTRGQRLAAALLSAAAIHLGVMGVASAGAIHSDLGCFANSLPASDDGASGPVYMGFSINLNGNVYSNIFVDTNGYVMFGTPPPTFFDYASLRLDTTNQLIIAPFLADIDTRGNAGNASEFVTYGQINFGSNSSGPIRAFCVNWGVPLVAPGTKGVGYFDRQADLRNRFQLLLVERSDRNLGDVDIIMNYDQIQWDLPAECANGVCPTMAGFFAGTSSSRQPLRGPGMPGALLDNGISSLVNNTNTGTLGRYTFAITNGVPPSNAAIPGTVYDPNGLPLAGAPVQACFPSTSSATACEDLVQTVTNGLGNYVLTGFNETILDIPFAEYVVTVSAPTNTGWLPPTTGPRTATMNHGNVASPIDFTLSGPQGIPAATTLSPSNPGAASVPTVFWGNPLTLSTHGCANGTASYTVQQNNGVSTSPIAGGTLAELPTGSGAFGGSIPAFTPHHGYATISIVFGGSGCTVAPISFDIYIDPSGKVHNTHGAPIEGATATLFRSDGPFGPFDPVPDGSAIMSPSNRANPSYTDATGFFGWDVIAGYYIVRAEKAGCTSPLDPTLPYVETEVMRVPEEVTGLDLILNCDAVPPPVIQTPGDLTAQATNSAGAVVTYTTFASDSAGNPVGVTCAPASGSTFPLGTTAVWCGATNSAGNSASASFNVTVVDTAAPVLSLPAPITVFATNTTGSNVTYSASASDLVNGAITPACSPVSGSIFPVGTTSVACFAADTEGNGVSGSFPVNVVYDSLAILPPINPSGTSTFEQWHDILVKFTLGGASTGVANVKAQLFVAPVQGGVVGAELPALPSGHANKGNLFKYRVADGVYHYLLSTDTLAPGIYRFRIDLGDGVPHTIKINLKKH